MSEDSNEVDVIEFDEKVDAAIDRLRRAQQDYPNEAEFAAAEARLWQSLGKSELAELSLERAIKARPRSSGVFVRLSRLKFNGTGLEYGIQVLKEGLEVFPNDKSLHFELAKAYLACREVNVVAVKFCLRSSFSAEDHSFDARFLLAEFLFWQGEVEEAKELFEYVNKRAPEGFRSGLPSGGDVVTEKLGEFIGTVQNRKARFFFIRFGGGIQMQFFLI
jgi:tetratricopeptide (TPR) repeat protein